jgi:hypothetical protein
MALSTYEGSSVDDVHADPEEQATSFNPMISASPSTNSKLRLR